MPIYGVVDQINDNSVSTAKLQNLAVTTAKINTAAVTTAKIAASNITTALILDGNVTQGKLADGAVNIDQCDTDVEASLDLADSAIQTELDPVATALLAAKETAYAAGTAYQLTNTAAALTFGTTQPVITFTNTGTYAVRARVQLDYNAATFAAVRTVTAKLRRTNNTAADIANGSRAVKTQIVTLLTGTFLIVELPEVIVAVTAGDAWTIFASVNTVPSAGSLDAVAAEIVAEQKA